MNPRNLVKIKLISNTSSLDLRNRFHVSTFKYAKQGQIKSNKSKADTKERADHGEDSSNRLSFCGFRVLKAASHHHFCGSETFLKEMKMKRCN
ncbi:hypothetical protein L1887_29207 [Cichorium endivia]|nr:hypothetical protein L1887_29207 [Cichorium endivia]